MMIRLRIVLITLIAAIANMATAATDEPAIKFDERTHDFGTVKEQNGPVSHTFTFTNTGTAPLVILSAKTSCGCTTPSFAKRPIQPGESSEVKVTYTTAGHPGEFDKTVTLRTNVKGRNRKVSLRIQGTVIPKR